jgi:hypothetical protein
MKIIRFTTHATEMLVERNITEKQVYLAVNEPDRIEKNADGTTRYLKAIKENEGRMLRVVTDTKVNIVKVITLFFDRRIGR